MAHLPDRGTGLHGDDDKRGVSLSPRKSPTKNEPLSPDLDGDEDERGVSLHGDEDKRGVSLHPLVQSLATDDNASERKLDQERAQRVEDGDEDKRSVSLHPLLDSQATDEKESDWKVDEGQRRRAGKRQRDENEELEEQGLAGTGKLMRKTEAVENQLITAREGQELQQVGEITGRNKRLQGDNSYSGGLAGGCVWKAHQEQGGTEPPEYFPNNLATERQIEEPALVLCSKELPLRRNNQGIGAIFQQLGWVAEVQPRQEIEKQVKNLAAQRLARVMDSSISHLPVAIIQEILMKMQRQDFRHAIASSFIFLRAAVGPCNCNAFKDNNNFIGTVIQPRHGRPSVAVPDIVRYHPLQAVGIMFQKFIALSYKARQWYKIIDSRAGYLLVLRDSTGGRLDVMMPLQTMSVRTLPPVPLEVHEKFVSAAILPVDMSTYTVIMISRGGERIVVREFRSHTGLWQQRNFLCPSEVSSNHPLYTSNTIYLLDPPRKRMLRLSLDQNKLDAIALPVSVKPLPKHHHVLCRTSRGEVCWVQVALDQWKILVFVLDGAVWKLKWRWPLPKDFYSCRLIGFAQGSRQVMVECLGKIICIDVEEGSRTYLKEAAPTDNCLAFETDHLVLDHE